MDREKYKVNFVVKAVSLRPEDWAMIEAHAKESGIISRSAALRVILTEWYLMKMARAEVATR